MINFRAVAGKNHLFQFLLPPRSLSPTWFHLLKLLKLVTANTKIHITIWSMQLMLLKLYIT